MADTYYGGGTVVLADGEYVPLRRGDQLPSGISKADRERLVRRGRLEPPKVAATVEADAVSGEQSAPDLKVGDAEKLDDAALAAWVASGASVEQVLAAAGKKPENRARLLAAEDAATGGSPRDDVAEALKPDGE